MEVKVVRFSRPLLIRTSWYNDDYQYQTIYGFKLPESIDLTDSIDTMRMEQYMGYLAGLHFWSSGMTTEDGYFAIQEGRWVDESGEAHTKQDEWMTAMEIKCLLKLGLTYDVVSVEVDEEEFRYYVLNKELLVVNEDFYYDIERNLIYDTPCGDGDSSEDDPPVTSEDPLWDELPF